MSKTKNKDKPYDFSLTSLSRGLLLFLLPITAYILGLIPLIIGFTYLYVKISLLYQGIIWYVIVSTLAVIFFFFLLIIESFIPALFIRLFHIHMKPGEYQISIKDRNFFHHMLFFTLYRPSIKLISFLPLVPLRSALTKLVGLNIGKTSLLAGTEFIDEPYAVSIGEHTLIGGYASIYAHISHKTLRLKPVIIGNNCFIGNKSIILPGVTIEDDVIVEPGSVIPEDMQLKKGKRYAGNPATTISDEN